MWHRIISRLHCHNYRSRKIFKSLGFYFGKQFSQALKICVCLISIPDCRHKFVSSLHLSKNLRFSFSRLSIYVELACFRIITNFFYIVRMPQVLMKYQDIRLCVKVLNSCFLAYFLLILLYSTYTTGMWLTESEQGWDPTWHEFSWPVCIKYEFRLEILMKFWSWRCSTNS